MKEIFISFFGSILLALTIVEGGADNEVERVNHPFVESRDLGPMMSSNNERSYGFGSDYSSRRSSGSGSGGCVNCGSRSGTGGGMSSSSSWSSSSSYGTAPGMSSSYGTGPGMSSSYGTGQGMSSSYGTDSGMSSSYGTGSGMMTYGPGSSFNSGRYGSSSRRTGYDSSPEMKVYGSSLNSGRFRPATSTGHGSSYRTSQFGTSFPSQTSSSQYEKKEKEEFVNGQKVYDLYHEKEYKDGRLVKERHEEKNPEDFGFDRNSAFAHSREDNYAHMPRTVYGPSNGRSSSSYYQQESSQPVIRKVYSPHQTNSQQTVSKQYNLFGDDHDEEFDSEIEKMRQEMERRTLEIHQNSLRNSPSHGTKHRTEVRTQMKYVNGKPVFVKNEERKYLDGQLVHNTSTERGSENSNSQVSPDNRQPYYVSYPAPAFASSKHEERVESQINNSPQYRQEPRYTSNYYNVETRPSSSSGTIVQKDHKINYTPRRVYKTEVKKEEETISSRYHRPTPSPIEDRRRDYQSSSYFTQKPAIYVPKYETSRSQEYSRSHQYIPGITSFSGTVNTLGNSEEIIERNRGNVYGRHQPYPRNWDEPTEKPRPFNPISNNNSPSTTTERVIHDEEDNINDIEEPSTESYNREFKLIGRSSSNYKPVPEIMLPGINVYTPNEDRDSGMREDHINRGDISPLVDGKDDRIPQHSPRNTPLSSDSMSKSYKESQISTHSVQSRPYEPHNNKPIQSIPTSYHSSQTSKHQYHQNARETTPTQNARSGYASREGFYQTADMPVASKWIETKTVYKYINGKFASKKNYYKYYENGILIHQNLTEQSRDEMNAEGISVIDLDLSRDDLIRYGPLEPSKSTVHSQRHEVYNVERFKSGLPIYELHKEKKFQDGALVHENRQEQNEDDFLRANRELIQSQTGYNTARNTQSSGYSSVPYPRNKAYMKKYEVHEEEEFVNGQKVYDLHHEREFHNGNLIRENKTELGPNDLGVASSNNNQNNFLASRQGSEAYYQTNNNLQNTAHNSLKTTCITCGSLGHLQGSFPSGYSSQQKGYTYRKDQNVEEHYENGRLVKGVEDKKEWKDGQLTDAKTEHYYDGPSRTNLKIPEQNLNRLDKHSRHTGSLINVGNKNNDKCSYNPCINGGTCKHNGIKPVCICPFGFKGSRCEEIYCPGRYCRYGGTCSVQDEKHVCDCLEGYTGNRCMTRIYKINMFP